MVEYLPLNGELDVRQIKLPGPVAQEYFFSNDPIAAIVGPAGSGKTTTSVLKCFRNTLKTPMCRDGVIRARGCVLRDNYRALSRTTLQTWFQLFPKDHPGSTFEGGQDRPATHRLNFITDKGIRVEMEVNFFAIGDHSIEELLKGYEPTWVWINEMDMIPPRVLDLAYSRLGRYPAEGALKQAGSLRLNQVFADFNPTDIDHWVYKRFVDEPAPGHRLFRQPSGLSDEAENRNGVNKANYEQKAMVLSAAEKRRFVDGEWGYSSDGKPVYPEFSESLHVRDVIEPDRNIPLSIGMDAGGTPAAVIGQLLPTGQLRVLDELVPGHGCGPSRFAEALTNHLRSARYHGIPLGKLTVDPSAFYGGDKVTGEFAWVETVSKALGRPIDPCETNEPLVRTDAVRNLLTRLIDGSTPSLIVARHCRLLVGGFAANYKYKRHMIGVSERFEDRPLKNDYSHPHDALQYLVLGLKGRFGVIEESARGGRAGNIHVLNTGIHIARCDVNPRSVLHRGGGAYGGSSLRRYPSIS